MAEGEEIDDEEDRMLTEPQRTKKEMGDEWRDMILTIVGIFMCCVGIGTVHKS